MPFCWMSRQTGSSEARDSGAAKEPEDPDSRSSHRERRQEHRRLKKRRDQIHRRIERLEEDILEREKQHETLQWEAGSQDVFRDPERVREIERLRQENQDQIASGYRNWERLADELAALDDALERFESPNEPT